jgi:putative membrane protein
VARRSLRLTAGEQDRHRAEAEVRQHAEVLFRSHRLDRTRARVGILLLLSLFERRACLLPDAAIRGRVSDTELADVIARVTQAAARAARSRRRF